MTARTVLLPRADLEFFRVGDEIIVVYRNQIGYRRIAVGDNDSLTAVFGTGVIGGVGVMGAVDTIDVIEMCLCQFLVP